MNSMNFIDYFSIKIHRTDFVTLYEIVNKYFKIPDDWRIYGDHMTVLHHTNKDFDVIAPFLQQFHGCPLSIFITGIGISKNVVALMYNNISGNKQSHITMAVAPGHKPVESNDIKDNEIIWFDTVITVLGTFRIKPFQK